MFSLQIDVNHVNYHRLAGYILVCAIYGEMDYLFDTDLRS